MMKKQSLLFFPLASCLLLLASSITHAQATQFYLEDKIGDGLQARIYLIAEPQAKAQVQEALYAAVDHVRVTLTSIQQELADIAQKGTPGNFMVSPELAQVLQAGLALSKKTNGHFSIAASGDYKKINVSTKSNTVKLNDANLQIGLDSILKGFLADLIAQDLVKAGWVHCLVKIENVYVTRGNDATKPWRIPVVIPSNKQAKRVLYYQTKKESAAGATWTERKDSSASSDLGSVTIFSKSGVDSQGLATAVFKMGLENGKKFLARQRSLSAILVDNQGNLTNVP